MSSAIEDLEKLFRPKAQSCKFANIGDTHTLTIEEIETREQRDFTTGRTLYYEDGETPRPELVIRGTKDDSNELWAIYAKNQMLGAVKEAVRRAGEEVPATGGVITITYSSDGEASVKGYRAPKQYDVTYTPPKAAKLEAVMSSDEPAKKTTPKVKETTTDDNPPF